MPPATARAALTPQLMETGVVAILRASSVKYFQPAAEALVRAGLTCLEVTLTTPGALDALSTMADGLPPEAAVGAGTVTSAAQASAAVAAGAQFLVSPAVCADVIAFAAEAGLPCYPGAWTPTEVLAAWRAGATAVKLFPAASGGPEHLRRLRDPLPDIPLVPTGGIAIEHVRGYLAVGAIAVGLGSPLLGDALAGGDLAALAGRASRVLGEISAARAQISAARAQK